ncbi:putative alpha/beta superfamily hydrolase [Streptococcus pneumoniae]|nr:putative alpha/beta superfamily hydrolase [Streptococcus pneumoniae]
MEDYPSYQTKSGYQYISRMIVVAIDNDGMGRMNEYAAWKFQESPIPEQQFGGKGVEYAEFVMEVVKPFIDETYRTKADCQHTAMIGSSLGGNIPSLSVWNTKTKLVAWAFFHLQTGSTKKPLTAISSARNYRLTSASSSM